MREYLARRNLNEERFSLAKVQGNTVQKEVMAAEVEAAYHLCAQSGHSNKQECSAHFLLLLLSPTLSHGVTLLLTVKMGLPDSVSLI